MLVRDRAGSLSARKLALCDPGALQPHLAAWADQAGGGQVTWRRTFGRIYPTEPTWAVLAFTPEPRGLPVRVDISASPDGPGVPDPRLGTVLVRSLDDDPGMPTLGPAMGALDRPVVVRYRPGRRCVLRGGSEHGQRFVKIAEGAERHHREAGCLWEAWTRGELAFRVARPAGWSEDTRSAWYDVVPGDPIVAGVLGPHGVGLARRLGTALGELSRSTLRPERREGPDSQLLRTERALRRTASQLREPWDALAPLLDSLAARQAGFGPRALVPVHGAPHMHQWLEGPEGLGLVDFDRFAYGEPELDLATFLAELETEKQLGAPLADLRAAITDGFASGSGRGVDEERVDTYLVHKRIAKVARTAFAIRPDGHARARSHLARVRRGQSLN